MLGHFIRAHWLLFVSLVFLTAVALTAARLWVPSLGGYRHELETAASRALNRNVSIGKLEATWRGLGPVLKLRNVVIDGPAGKPGRIDIREVWIRLDVDHYITERKVRASGVDVIGTDLGITRDENGRLYIEEFSGPAEENPDLDDFLQMHRLSINDSVITITDLKSGEPPRRFSDVTLALVNDGYEHRLSGYLLLPAELGYRVDVEAELYGKGVNYREWQGQVYVNGQTLALADLVAPYLPYGMSVQGIADIRLWLDYSLARLQSVSGEVDAHDIRLDSYSGDKSYRFSADVMQGQLGWKRAAGMWQFALQDFLMTQGDETWKTQNLSLAGIEVDGVNQLELVSEQTHLHGLGALVSVFPGLADEHRSNLAAMHPRGTINNLELRLEYAPDVTTVRGFSAGFSNISIEQSGVYPAVSGLSGTVAGTPEKGLLSLNGHSLVVNDENLFRGAFLPAVVHGDIDWQVSGEHVEVGSGSLHIENRDLSLQAAFGLDFPVGDSAPVLQLQLAVEKADLGTISRYLPAKRMPATGVSWLDKSLVSGYVTDGTVVINGRLDQIPFDNNEGQLEVRLPVKNAVLDYNREWSPLTGLDAQVDFSGRSMDIHSKRGAIRSALLEQVHVRIKDLARPVLTLSGSVKGPLTVMLAELGSSPLGETYGGFVDRVITSGQSRLDLDLQMPLHGKERTAKVSGLVELDDDGLSIKDSTIALKKIKGTLVFDDKGIRGENLTARFNDKPAKVTVWSGSGEPATHISLDGKLGLLRQIVGSKSALYPAISGNSDWRVILSVQGAPRRGEKARLSLHAGSMLEGTAIDLPAPFGKDSSSRRELSVDVARIDYPQKQLRLKYGNILNGLLEFTADGQTPVLQGGVITFGGNVPDTSVARKLLVSGHLDKIHTTAWKPYLDSGTPGLGLPVEYDLKVDELEVLGHYIREASLQMQAEGLVWDIKAGGPSISGEIQLTKTGAGLHKVVMNLQRLVVQSGSKDRPPDEPGVMPGSFPNLQIVAQQFVYDDSDLGNFQLATEKKPGNTLKITRLILSSELLAARMSGTWKLQKGQQRSNVDVEVSSGKMDELLKIFGFQQSIEGGKLSGTLRAAWAGPPWAFSPSMAEGQLDVLIEKGQLVDLEPGAAGRVLGLLSLNNIRRRLLLDFSDLFGEGFSFDRIEGSFSVDGGNAYTSDLIVKGPAAKIDITGRVGLAAQDYDQLVTVTPSVKTPFSLAGTLVGGPAVGAAIMVAETLLEGKIEVLNRMVRTQYTVTGPWSAPEIQKIGSSGDAAAGQPQ